MNADDYRQTIARMRAGELKDRDIYAILFLKSPLTGQEIAEYMGIAAEKANAYGAEFMVLARAKFGPNLYGERVLRTKLCASMDTFGIIPDWALDDPNINIRPPTEKERRAQHHLEQLSKPPKERRRWNLKKMN